MNLETTRQSLLETSDAPTRVGLDRVDRLPISVLPEALTESTDIEAAATALATEGARGPAAHRLLARDVVLGRTQLRYLEARRNLSVEAWLAGKTSANKVRLLEQLVNGQHRRLMAAIDALVRAGGASMAVRVTAYQAAISVSGGQP